MGYLKAGDTISGQEAKAFMTMDGKVEEMFYIKSLESTVEKNKAEVKTLGKRGTQYKANGWSGSGSMTIYYATSKFRQMMLEYMKTGKDTYFDVQVTNDDPTSTIGAQTIVLKNVNLDKVPMAVIDTEADTLEEDIDFTFDDVDMLDQFGTPTLG